MGMKKDNDNMSVLNDAVKHSEAHPDIFKKSCEDVESIWNSLRDDGSLSQLVRYSRVKGSSKHGPDAQCLILLARLAVHQIVVNRISDQKSQDMILDDLESQWDNNELDIPSIHDQSRK